MSKHHQPQRRPSDCAEIALIVGGTGHVLAAQPEIMKVDGIVVADVAGEAASLASAARAVRIRLGDRQTLTMVMKDHCNPRVQKFLKNRPAILASCGLAAYRPAGAKAMEDRLNDPDVVRSLDEELFQRIFKQFNGDLPLVVGWEISSGAGGTGSAASRELTSRVLSNVLERTDATVHLHIVRMGSLSYMGCGDRVDANSAATIVEDLARVTDPDRGDREIRQLTLLEGPMVGNCRAEREQFTSLFFQTVRTPEVWDDLRIVEPNLALSGPLGAVSTVRCSSHRGVPGREIAAEAADAYLPPLQALLGCEPTADAIGPLTVQLGEANDSRPVAVEQLIATARGATGVMREGFASQCADAGLRYVGGRVMARIGQTEHNLTRSIRTIFSEPCGTVGEYRRKLGVMKALAERLASEQASRQARLVATQRAHGHCGAELDAALCKVFPRTWKDRACSVFRNGHATMHGLKDAIIRTREAGTELERLERETKLLADVQRELEGELKAEQRRLVRARESLERAREMKVESDLSLVEVKDLNDVFPDLMDLCLVAQPDLEEMVRLLARSVARVTVDGLARIVEAPEPRLDAIARQLCRSKLPCEPPHWGGRAPSTAPKRITVLPPIDPDIKERLRARVREHDDQMLVFSADTAAAGVNVVRLEIWKPRYWEDIVTPFIEKNLEEAVEQRDHFFTMDIDVASLRERLNCKHHPRSPVAEGETKPSASQDQTQPGQPR